MTQLLAVLAVWGALWPFLFLGSIVVSIAFVIYQRRAYDRLVAAGGMPTDRLSMGERIVVILTIFFAGVVIPGATYYYGLRSRYPSKARSVRHIVWADLAVFAAILSAFFYFRESIAESAGRQALGIYEQELNGTQAVLATSPESRREKKGYAITLPAALGEYDEVSREGETSNSWGSNEANVFIVVTSKEGSDADLMREDGGFLIEDFSRPSIRGAKQAVFYKEVSDLLGLSMHTLYLEVDGADGMRYEAYATAAVGAENAAFADELKRWLLSFEVTAQ